MCGFGVLATAAPLQAEMRRQAHDGHGDDTQYQPQRKRLRGETGQMHRDPVPVLVNDVQLATEASGATAAAEKPVERAQRTKSASLLAEAQAERAKPADLVAAEAAVSAAKAQAQKAF